MTTGLNDEGMTLFREDSFIIKPYRLSEFIEVLMRFKTVRKEQPDLFKEIKSYKVFTYMLGGKWGGMLKCLSREPHRI
jgi:hypothetical protein